MLYRSPLGDGSARESAEGESGCPGRGVSAWLATYILTPDWLWGCNHMDVRNVLHVRELVNVRLMCGASNHAVKP